MFINRIKAAFCAVILATLGVVPAFALSSDPVRIIPARDCAVGQNVCYMRATINYNDPNIGNGVWGFTFPANAYVLSIDADVTTAFNAATTNTLAVGTTAGGVDLVATSGANASVTMGTTGIYHLTSAAGLGVAVTGNTSKQTAINGGVPVYFKYAQTGTAASAGSVTVVITFARNNDK